MIIHRISITKYYTDNEEPLIDPIKPYVGISTNKRQNIQGRACISDSQTEKK